MFGTPDNNKYIRDIPLYKMNLANALEFRVAEVSSILDRKHNRQSVNAIDQFAIDDNNSRQKEKKKFI